MPAPQNDLLKEKAFIIARNTSNYAVILERDHKPGRTILDCHRSQNIYYLYIKYEPGRKSSLTLLPCAISEAEEEKDLKQQMHMTCQHYILEFEK